MEEFRGYYAVIPANVRYDTKLPANAKLLYGEITALCNEKGYCWASNEYFAQLYSASVRSVASWLKALKDENYIAIELIYKKNSKEVDKRYIKIAQNFVNEKTKKGGAENCNRVVQISAEGVAENCRDNNTYINNNTTTCKSDENEEKKVARKIEPTIPYTKIVDKYNEICTGLRKIKHIPENRKKAIKARFNSGYNFDDFVMLFELTQKSDFLTGKVKSSSSSHKNWKASFDWLINDSNMTKVLEGNYDNAVEDTVKHQHYSKADDDEDFEQNKHLLECLEENS